MVIWPNDHAPAHVHVFSADAEAKIELYEGNAHPRLLENRRMQPTVLARALEAVYEHRALLMQSWREIHGGLDSQRDATLIEPSDPSR